jgi:hypothetical protein
MLFTSTDTIPHEDIVDVLRAYPHWKFMFNNVTEVSFSLTTNQHDPDYKKFWARVLANPEEEKYFSIKEGSI